MLTFPLWLEHVWLFLYDKTGLPNWEYKKNLSDSVGLIEYIQKNIYRRKKLVSKKTRHVIDITK